MQYVSTSLIECPIRIYLASLVHHKTTMRRKHIPYKRMLCIIKYLIPCRQYRILIMKVSLVYLLISVFLFPSLRYHLRFSKIYDKHDKLSLKNAIDINYRRRMRASNFLKTLNPQKTREMYIKNGESSHLRFVVGVVTVARNERKLDKHSQTEYLTQVLSRLHEILISTRVSSEVFLFICNTDPNPDNYSEANRMAEYFPNITRSFAKIEDYFDVKDILSTSRHIQEKKDYGFCLQSALKYKSKYVLLVQDDAYPNQDFYDVLDSVLRAKLETKIERGEVIPGTKDWAWLKLIQPYYLSGFSQEPFVICQLLSLASILAGFSTLVFHMYHECREVELSTPIFERNKCRMKISVYIVFVVSFLWSLIILEVVGRPYYLKLRGLSPNFYSLEPGTSCCLPAVLYPVDKIPGILDFLKNDISADHWIPLDLALDEYRKHIGLKQYLLTPNSFTHIGFYSTLNMKFYTNRAYAYEYFDDWN